MNFDVAIGRILSHEGGYTINPADRGNWTSGKIGVGKLNGTKYGISAMTYPNEDIKNLTWLRAKEIYRRDFWAPLAADQLHDGVAYQLLDFAVNSGIPNAIRAYQRALKVTADGAFGPKSLAASHAMSETDQVLRLIAERIEFMVNAKSWLDFSRGWMRRIAINLRLAAEDS